VEKKMSKQSFQDLSNAEIDAVKAQIVEARDDLRKTDDRLLEYNKKRHKILENLESLKVNLERAKKQATVLKKFVWVSDNPNIVDLRNQLLLAAKLIKDHDDPPKGKK